MKKKLIMFLAAAYCATTGALAEGTESADTLVRNLEGVEVVATRATTKTPIAFTNVSGAQLDKANSGADLPYLLLSTPSVIATSDAGAGVGYTSIRVRGTDSSRINVTANGIPVNDSESHNVYWVNLPDMASSLQDLQIQRGAGTSTNGAGAFGASINMQTDYPSLDPYGRLDLSYGTYRTGKQTLRAGTGLMGGHWTLDMRLSHVASDGYIDRAWSKLWSYFAQAAYLNGGTTLRLLAFGGKEQTYQAWDYASKEDMEKYGRRYNPCGKYTDSDGLIAYYPDQTDNYAQHHFQLIYNQQLPYNMNLTAALHYTKGDGYYHQYKTKRTLVEYGLQPFEDADGNTIKKSDLIRYKKMDNGFGGGVFSLTKTGKRYSVVFGGAVNNYKGHHFGQIDWVRNYIGAIDPLQEYYRNCGKKLDGNVYLRGSFDIVAGLSAFADMQYRHINYRIDGISDTFDWNIMAMSPLAIKRHYNFFNPKGGLNWEINRHHRVYGSVAVAHKEPTRDNFVDADPDRLPVAERLTDWELGYVYSSRVFSAGVNLYKMGYKNQLVPTGQLSDTGNAVSVNVPRSYRMGVEVNWKLKPVKWFDWEFTATLSRNRINDFTEYIYEDEWTNPITFNLGDTPIAFSPDFTFHNAFNFNWKGFEGTLASRYVSKQYLNNTGSNEAVLDAYFVSDLHLAYTFRGLLGMKELRLGFSVLNLFNEKYENNGYAGAGYYVGEGGEKIIYRYAGYAAQAPTHVMGTMSVTF